MVFYDADVFDLTFADELKLGTPEVQVNFASPTSLNAFPPRMNVWLAEVRKTDGTISVVDPSHPGGTRSLFGIGRTRQAQAQRMALADAYNAKIAYDSTTGMAREVLFTRHPLAAGTTPPVQPAALTSPESTGPASTGPASTGPASTGPASTGAPPSTSQ